MISPPRKMADGEHLTAANYNALLDYVKRITPRQGANVSVDYRLGGAFISGTPGGADARAQLKPFTVRWHEGQWEIYMPSGCVNVGGSCDPINPAAASGGSAHAEEPDGWRILVLGDESGTTGTDGNGHSYREWTVAVHAKTSAKMFGVDDLNAPARRLAWAGLNDQDTQGDTFACNVARVRATTVSGGGETETVRTVTQLRDTPIDVSPADAGTSAFGLVWYFSVTGGQLTVERVFCLRQLVSVAGMSVTGNTMTDVTGADWVYARINTADMTDGRGLITVVSDPSNPHVSTDLVTWLALFRMDKNTVTEDYRENSIRNIQLYRA